MSMRGMGHGARCATFADRVGVRAGRGCGRRRAFRTAAETRASIVSDAEKTAGIDFWRRPCVRFRSLPDADDSGCRAVPCVAITLFRGLLAYHARSIGGLFARLCGPGAGRYADPELGSDVADGSTAFKRNGEGAAAGSDRRGALFAEAALTGAPRTARV
jgi:hypothetical protein